VTAKTIDTTEASASWQPYLAFVGACAIWGSTFLVIRIGNEAIPPLWAATLRLALATVLLFGVARLTRAAFPRGSSLRDTVLYGIFQFGLNFGLLYWGENAGVPSGVTAVVYATVPLSTALFAAAIGVERLDPLKLGAAVLGLGGVAVIFADQLGVGVPIAGLAAILASSTSASISSVFLKRARSMSPFMANAIGSLVGLPLCFVAAVLLGENITLPRTFEGWAPVLYLTLLGSLGAYVLFSWLLQKWSATNASFIGVVIPVIALALGAVVRNEQPGGLAFVGAAIVIASVVLSVIRGTGH
jgi:drug/metabolite transporter (DMT)-like permease